LTNIYDLGIEESQDENEREDRKKIKDEVITFFESLKKSGYFEMTSLTTLTSYILKINSKILFQLYRLNKDELNTWINDDMAKDPSTIIVRSFTFNYSNWSECDLWDLITRTMEISGRNYCQRKTEFSV